MPMHSFGRGILRRMAVDARRHDITLNHGSQTDRPGRQPVLAGGWR